MIQLQYMCLNNCSFFKRQPCLAMIMHQISPVAHKLDLDYNQMSELVEEGNQI